MSPLLLLKILSPNQIHQLALTLLLLFALVSVKPRKLDLLSGSLCSSSSSSSSFPLCECNPSLLSPVREGFSFRFLPSVSLSASSSFLALSAPNDFSPLSDLSPFPSPPPVHMVSPVLLLCFAPFFRQLVLPLHLFYSSCATALST